MYMMCTEINLADNIFVSVLKYVLNQREKICIWCVQKWIYLMNSSSGYIWNFGYILNLFVPVLKYVLNQREDTTKSSYFASCSLTYILAMVASNMALQWVPYPTQVREAIKAKLKHLFPQRRIQPLYLNLYNITS